MYNKHIIFHEIRVYRVPVQSLYVWFFIFIKSNKLNLKPSNPFVKISSIILYLQCKRLNKVLELIWNVNLPFDIALPLLYTERFISHYTHRDPVLFQFISHSQIFPIYIRTRQQHTTIIIIIVDNNISHFARAEIITLPDYIILIQSALWLLLLNSFFATTILPLARHFLSPPTIIWKGHCTNK